jgi:small-conductance mechanosensitive channel
MRQAFLTWLESIAWQSMLHLLLALLLFLLAARLLLFLARRALIARLPKAKQAFVFKLGLYSLSVLAVIAAFQVAGFNITWLVGAAGIFSVALGFASQTSASNFISGLFLMGERPFQEGDTILLDGLQGQVIGIDLLSVKLRTFDNLYVRIPNETVIKARLTNYTYFAIRRVEIAVGLAYGSDLGAASTLLLETALGQPFVLRQPEPEFRASTLGSSAIECSLLFWVEREQYLSARTAMIARMVAVLQQAGFEIPFPQTTVHLHRLGQEKELAKHGD